MTGTASHAAGAGMPWPWVSSHQGSQTPPSPGTTTVNTTLRTTRLSDWISDRSADRSADRSGDRPGDWRGDGPSVRVIVAPCLICSVTTYKGHGSRLIAWPEGLT